MNKAVSQFIAGFAFFITFVAGAESVSKPSESSRSITHSESQEAALLQALVALDLLALDLAAYGAGLTNGEGNGGYFDRKMTTDTQQTGFCPLNSAGTLPVWQWSLSLMIYLSAILLGGILSNKLNRETLSAIRVKWMNYLRLHPSLPEVDDEECSHGQDVHPSIMPQENNAQAERPVLTQLDQAFLQKLDEILDKHFADEDFNVAALVEEMGGSHRQVARKVKCLLGLTLVEYIRNFRLNKAAELLSTGARPSLVAFDAGFTSHAYFSKCFKAHYHCLPSQFAKQQELKIVLKYSVFCL